MKIFRLVCVSFLFVILFAGCSGANTFPAAPTPIISLSPTNSALASSSPTPSQTPVFTPTPFFNNQKANFPSGWITYTNANENIEGLAFDQNGFLWAASQGGLVKWDISNHTYKKYTTADGLPRNSINAVRAGKNGILWIETSNIISSFDGYNWNTYQIPDKKSYITKMFEDSTGKIWLLGNTVTTFDGKNWKIYTTDDGLGSDAAKSITEDVNHNIWLGTTFMYCGCEAEQSIKYIEGVSRFNGRKWDVFGKTIGIGDGNILNGSPWVEAIAADAKGGLWFATKDDGLVYYDGKKPKTFTAENGLPEDPIMDIKITKDGTVWFLTYSSGVVSYKNSKFTPIPATKDLKVLTLEIGPDQSIWLGTDYGIYHLNGDQLDPYLTEDMIPDTLISDIYSTKQGAVWLATDRGIAYTDGAHWQYITEHDGLPSNDVRIVRIAPDGSLWAATNEMLFHLVNHQWIIEKEFKKDDKVYDLAFDNKGGVWVGAKSVYHFDGIQWTKHFSYDDNVYDYTYSHKLTYSSLSGIWAGGWNKLANFDGTFWTMYGGTKDFGADIHALATAPDGKIWVASKPVYSDSGIDFNSFNGTTRKHETTPLSKLVTDMDFAGDGTLWVATTDDGAYHYDGTNWTHYGIQDGLAGIDVKSIHVAGDGAIWFATEGGVTRFGK